MKTKVSYLVFSFFLMSIISVAQTLTLSFDGQNNGQVVALEKIFIENLNKACDTTLFYPNSSITLQVLGVETPEDVPTRLTVFQNVPNPVLETTAIKIFNPSLEHLSIVVLDIVGRPVSTYHANLERGYHIFNFSPGRAGTYLFSVSSLGLSHSIKLISKILTTSGISSLQYSGTIGNEKSWKAKKSERFVFSPGDSLRYTGFYNSMAKTLFDSPQTNKTYTFEFSSSSFTCGQNLTINHLASGGVAPVNKTTTYGTVTNIPGETAKCWITSNLGSDHQATSVDDTTEASAGWYWQFNRKQGYKHDGTIRTPETGWQYIYEDFSWRATNDPCAIELGSPWRLPSSMEWHNLINAGGWTNWSGIWNSSLKLHAAGMIDQNGVWLTSRGVAGYYWTGNQHEPNSSHFLFIANNSIDVGYGSKSYGWSVRCIRNN